jgi:hypothetical protein
LPSNIGAVLGLRMDKITLLAGSGKKRTVMF